MNNNNPLGSISTSVLAKNKTLKNRLRSMTKPLRKVYHTLRRSGSQALKSMRNGATGKYKSIRNRAVGKYKNIKNAMARRQAQKNLAALFNTAPKKNSKIMKTLKSIFGTKKINSIPKKDINKVTNAFSFMNDPFYNPANVKGTTENINVFGIEKPKSSKQNKTAKKSLKNKVNFAIRTLKSYLPKRKVSKETINNFRNLIGKSYREHIRVPYQAMLRNAMAQQARMLGKREHNLNLGNLNTMLKSIKTRKNKKVRFNSKPPNIRIISPRATQTFNDLALLALTRPLTRTTRRGSL